MPTKRWDLLLRGVAPVLGPRRQLLLLGAGEEEAHLRKLAAFLYVDAWVRFLGARLDSFLCCRRSTLSLRRLRRRHSGSRSSKRSQQEDRLFTCTARRLTQLGLCAEWYACLRRKPRSERQY